MALIDVPGREVRARVVYYGPAFGGKTTNLRQVERRVPARSRGNLFSICDADDRTLFLDDLPLDLGQVGGWRVRLGLFSVPGQTRFERTRLAVLAGADGVVFVADSDPGRQVANAESFAELRQNLSAAGHDLARFPLVVEANKRDLPNAVSIAELRHLLGAPRRPLIPAVASRGEGVFDALQSIAKLVAASL